LSPVNTEDMRGTNFILIVEIASCAAHAYGNHKEQEQPRHILIRKEPSAATFKPIALTQVAVDTFGEIFGPPEMIAPSCETCWSCQVPPFGQDRHHGREFHCVCHTPLDWAQHERKGQVNGFCNSEACSQKNISVCSPFTAEACTCDASYKYSEGSTKPSRGNKEDQQLENALQVAVNKALMATLHKQAQRGNREAKVLEDVVQAREEEAAEKD